MEEVIKGILVVDGSAAKINKNYYRFNQTTPSLENAIANFVDHDLLKRCCSGWGKWILQQTAGVGAHVALDMILRMKETETLYFNKEWSSL